MVAGRAPGSLDVRYTTHNEGVQYKPERVMMSAMEYSN